jgi:hypothetical protein
MEKCPATAFGSWSRAIFAVATLTFAGGCFFGMIYLIAAQ